MERGRNKTSEFERAVDCIRRDYFGVPGRPPTYDEADFETQFRMPRSIFLRIYEDVNDQPWWSQRPNATGKLRARQLQKPVAVMKLLAYGILMDSTDEYTQLNKTTVNEAITCFVSFTLDNHRSVYLRAPTHEDLQMIMARNAERGMPGCIENLDCSHWRRTKCAVEYGGMYQKGGRGRQRMIVLENVCDEDLWIWNVLAGSPGSKNDLNVLVHNLLMVNVNRGLWPLPGLHSTENGTVFNTSFYLVDGIHSRCSFIVSSHAYPTSAPERALNRMQEAMRKDAERLCAVLTARLHIALYPARLCPCVNPHSHSQSNSYPPQHDY